MQADMLQDEDQQHLQDDEEDEDQQHQGDEEDEDQQHLHGDGEDEDQQHLQDDEEDEDQQHLQGGGEDEDQQHLQGDGEDEDQQHLQGGGEEEITTMIEDDTGGRSSRSCSERRRVGLPRRRIGDTVNASCQSGLFDGKHNRLRVLWMKLFMTVIHRCVGV